MENELLGLHYAIWIVLVLYFAGMLLLGWWSKRGIRNREGFLLGSRQFGTWYMVMHAFGAGTHPGDVASVTSKTVERGPSGIWASWMWMFGTPFYWLIAPIVRRMRCLTMADYFEQRFGRAACVLYVVVVTVGMTIATASVLLATTRTVQGMMGKAAVKPADAETTEPPEQAVARWMRWWEARPAGEGPAGSQPTRPAAGAPRADKPAAPWYSSAWQAVRDDPWFFGILLISTAVFVVYSYWGGIVAAIRTDMAQGLMIIALSFVAIPAAMHRVGGFSAAKAEIARAQKRWPADLARAKVKVERTSAAVSAAQKKLAAAEDEPKAEAAAEKLVKAEADDRTADAQLKRLKKGAANLHLFDRRYFSLLLVLLLCINAPFSMMAQPHLITVSGAGKTEWEGRVGFTYGNILKRICTMGWCILALCWLAYLLQGERGVHPDAAFGDSVRELLHPVLQGLMLACVLAAAMSSGDALQVTIAGLFSQNIYRPYLRRGADEGHYVKVTRIAGVVIIAASLCVAIAMRASVVKTILDYFNLTATVGVAVVMGILWRRMNSSGVFLGTIAAAGTFLVTRYGLNLPRAATTALPLLAGLVGGVVGSLLTRRPRREVIERFFRNIYTPIGQEQRLALPLDEAVPPKRRWLTWGGLFLVKPSRQSWVGFVVTLAICLACLGAMLWLVRF